MLMIPKGYEKAEPEVMPGPKYVCSYLPIIFLFLKRKVKEQCAFPYIYNIQYPSADCIRKNTSPSAPDRPPVKKLQGILIEWAAA
jgi:hypothetical protein